MEKTQMEQTEECQEGGGGGGARAAELRGKARSGLCVLWFVGKLPVGAWVWVVNGRALPRAFL